MCFYLIKYDVIVIASGLAGLTASLKLAKSGKKVALFEKHSIPGVMQQILYEKEKMEISTHLMYLFTL